MINTTDNENAPAAAHEALADRQCVACNDKLPPLSSERVNTLFMELHTDWDLEADGQSLMRKFKFKGFAKAVYLSNLCAWLADQQGHHPDIAFGWGYCHVTLTTHNTGSLSENDFIWAAKLDQLLREFTD